VEIREKIEREFRERTEGIASLKYALQSYLAYIQ
jgi:hypothetical protein